VPITIDRVQEAIAPYHWLRCRIMAQDRPFLFHPIVSICTLWKWSKDQTTPLLPSHTNATTTTLVVTTHPYLSHPYLCCVKWIFLKQYFKLRNVENNFRWYNLKSFFEYFFLDCAIIESFSLWKINFRL